MKNKELLHNKRFQKALLDNLDDLCRRLQDDYNGGDKFDQLESDRLTVYDACLLLEEMLA